MDQEGAYLVFCNEEKAKDLLTARLVQELESAFHIKIEYQAGTFVIQRGNMSVGLHQKCKHALIHLVNTYNANTPAVQWFWYNKSTFVPYDSASTGKIEESFKAQQRYLILEVQGKPYQVDLAKWRQTDLLTHMWRPIARNPMPQVATPQAWGYWNEGQYVALSNENGQELHRALQSRRSYVTLQVNDKELKADLTRLTLRDEGERREFKLAYQ